MEVIVKLAKALDVSVDYLFGEGLNTSYDKEMHIFHYMDLVIRDNKSQDEPGFCV